jgi:hypothetical protein
MSFHRTILGVCTAVFATVFASAAFAQCCGGIAVAPVVAPAAVVQEVIQPVMAVQPVIPAMPVVAAPIAVDNWDTNGWGCGGCGGCGSTFGYQAVPSPLYVVNQGPAYAGLGMMVPYGTYSPAAGLTRRVPLRRRSALRLRFTLRLRPALWLRGALWLRRALRLRPLARLTRSCFRVIGEGLRVPRRPSFFVGSIL